MRQLVRIGLPVPAVKGFDGDVFRLRIETADVHIVTVGIGTRNIIGFDAAGFAEQMFGLAAVKGVTTEIVRTLQQAEFLSCFSAIRKKISFLRLAKESGISIPLLPVYLAICFHTSVYLPWAYRAQFWVL